MKYIKIEVFFDNACAAFKVGDLLLDAQLATDAHIMEMDSARSCAISGKTFTAYLLQATIEARLFPKCHNLIIRTCRLGHPFPKNIRIIATELNCIDWEKYDAKKPMSSKPEPIKATPEGK